MPKKHRVEQGESITLLADKYGVSSSAIWDDPANKQLKEKRPDLNILLAGDIVNIPDLSDKKVEAASGKKHSFKRIGVPAKFTLQLFNVDEPRANQNYTLDIDGAIKKGKTDSKGILTETLPVNAKKGFLIMDSADHFRAEIEFGYLNPISDISGVQMRLNNLGYYVGEPTGKLDELTRSGLAKFQRAHDIDNTGELTDETTAKLEEVHDHESKV